MNFKELWTTFNGRINRQPYWYGTLLLSAILLIMWLILGALFIGLLGVGPDAQLIRQMIFTAIIAYPVTALMVQRLHDRNRPGIIAAIFWAPTVLLFAGDLSGLTSELAVVDGVPMYLPNTAGWIILAFAFVIWIWMIVELGVLKGTDGPNRIGPDPLETSD